MKCGSTNGRIELTEEQRKILAALSRSKEPCGSKEIAAAVGLEAKVISSQLTAMKKKGLVDSPVRCKYAVTSEGKTIIG